MPLKQYESIRSDPLLGLVFFYASVSKDAPWYTAGLCPRTQGECQRALEATLRGGA